MGEESLTMMSSFPDLMVALLDYKLAGVEAVVRSGEDNGCSLTLNGD